MAVQCAGSSAVLVEENLETVNSQGPLLPFTTAVRTARFISRRQRFLMEVEDTSGRFMAHTNNTGAMLGLVRPGTEALLSVSDNPKRKLACTVELLRLGLEPDAPWAGVNTATPNRMLKAAWLAKRMPELEGYDTFIPEPPFPGGRLDARLRRPQEQGALPLDPAGGAAPPRTPAIILHDDAQLYGGSGGPLAPRPPEASNDLFIEAKNVTLVEDGAAIFPDAATERGRKHLLELIRLAGTGVRAALFFLVQRPDGGCFGPADMIDPEYARLFWQAVDAGVEIWPYRALVSEGGIDLGERLPLVRRGCV